MLSSKKEEAKIFRKWIAKEILPAIRKYGEYKLNKKIEKLTKDFNEQILKEKEKLTKDFNEQILKEKEKLTKDFNEQLRIKDEQILLLNKEINLNSKQNIFKLCKTALNNLKKKISIYNTRTDSPYYCVYYKKIYSVE